MALARERAPQSSQTMQGFDPPQLEFFGFKGHASMLEEGGYSDEHLPSLFDLQESQSIVNFKSAADHWAYSTSTSVLSFEQGERLPNPKHPSVGNEDECAAWIDTMDHEYHADHDAANGYRCMEDRFSLLYPSTSGAVNCLQEGVQMERSSQKRPYMGGDMQAAKKLCDNNRKAKAKPSPSKDPQSIAAKNRRERISERLKVLQELVPNGTKVDLVTMLEKAISYVKFLQLQVKVLATDEFWPAQGGKAPEVAQVKEAIDAILSSHRGTNSNPKH